MAGVSAFHPSANLKNPLLVRDEVGVAKPSCFNLPSSSFTFGKEEKKDTEGARELTSSWDFGLASSLRATSAASSGRARVLMRDGRRGVGGGKRETECRQLVGRSMRVKHNSGKDEKSVAVGGARESERGGVGGEAGRKERVGNHMPNEPITFGFKTRPSTPIGKLLSHHFGREGETDVASRYAIYREQREEFRKARKVARSRAMKNNLSSLRKAQIGGREGYHVEGGNYTEEESNTKKAEPFKMRAFTRSAAPRVFSCRRSSTGS